MNFVQESLVHQISAMSNEKKKKSKRQGAIAEDTCRELSCLKKRFRSGSSAIQNHNTFIMHVVIPSPEAIMCLLDYYHV